VNGRLKSASSKVGSLCPSRRASPRAKHPGLGDSRFLGNLAPACRYGGDEADDRRPERSEHTVPQRGVSRTTDCAPWSHGLMSRISKNLAH
jgi:hypothetical protein